MSNSPPTTRPKVTFQNKWEPPAYNQTTPPEDYDVNFASNAPITVLTSRRVELRPIIPSVHCRVMFDHWLDVPNIRVVHGANTSTFERLCEFTERCRKLSETLHYAIFVDPATFNPLPPNAPKPIVDPTASEGTEHWLYAGHSSISLEDPRSLYCSYGMNVLGQFTRHGIATEAVSLLLDWSLRMPEEGGLGLRRCEWVAHIWNEGSKRTALSAGFTFEGVKRNSHVLGERCVHDSNGMGRKGDAQWPMQSMNEWVTSITCEDWETGGLKEKIQARIR